uniref:Adenylate cyclase n=1 Tax=Hanusia phi TaxID=3032 RepID=A0A7S0I376_9CRYP|mmetsp:Transcript_897/g.1955  ORF Transcript_897/g.1955 Transcript_897/m.1955 type:complete len:1580 (+) Transcript_897:117-4856(+)|eukprot:746087-Hanusia_phi.AAC.1
MKHKAIQRKNLPMALRRSASDDPRHGQGTCSDNEMEYSISRTESNCIEYNMVQFRYYKSFLPKAAIAKVLRSTPTGTAVNQAKTLESSTLTTGMDAELRDAVVLLVDISGFTRLSDRFQSFGQEGIDQLTSTINHMFSAIIDRVQSYSGDIIKFAGDALIVIWECTESTQAQAVEKAINCAIALERHGVFKVHMPDSKTLEFADQLARHFAPAANLSEELSGNQNFSEETKMENHFEDDGDEWLSSAAQLQKLEIRRRLRAVPWFKALDNEEIIKLAEKCELINYAEGELIMQQGDEGDSMMIVHSGIVSVYKREDSTPSESSSGNIGFGKEIASREEGEMIGEVSLLSGERRMASIVAATNCAMLVVSREALFPFMQRKPELKSSILEVMNFRLSGKEMKFPSCVTLRLHQSISFGQVWFAHVGGAELDPHSGARKEFLVIGKALNEAALALDEADIGSIIVHASAWKLVCTEFEGEKTLTGNFELKFKNSPDDSLAGDNDDIDLERIDLPAMRDFNTCSHVPDLKMYCHEGARDLQDIAHLAGDVRRMTVLFVRLHLEDLDNPSLQTIQRIHCSLLAIQKATYERKGTLRQFLQDDKGVLAICVMGMPPFNPHTNDPLRAVLTAIEIRNKLMEMKIATSIGITSGKAYSGFVGSSSRREMCAMGSMVNMAARLMCKAAEKDIFVDFETKESSCLFVDFQSMQPLKVKGRDEPIEVYRVSSLLPRDEILHRVQHFVKNYLEVDSIPIALQSYLLELISDGECSCLFVKNVCNNLIREGHIQKGENGTILHCDNLNGLECGLTKLEAIQRGELNMLLYLQVLIKVLCFLSHDSYFNLSLARNVYCATFPTFGQHFDTGIKELIQMGVLTFAEDKDLESLFSSDRCKCNACSTWTKRKNGLQVSVHVQLFAVPGVGMEDLIRIDKNIVPSNNIISKRKVSEIEEDSVDIEVCKAKISEENDTEMKDVESGASRYVASNVMKIIVPGLVDNILKQLLRTYLHVWHRIIAEYYEHALRKDVKSSFLILAYFWTHACDHNMVEPGTVLKAMHYTLKAAKFAVENLAFGAALEMLQRACRMTNSLATMQSIIDYKVGLLLEMAPLTLLVYGHGSSESIAAYHGLRHVIKSATLDDQAVFILAGVCANLFARQLFESGKKIAVCMFRNGLKISPFHKEVGLCFMIQALHCLGDFAGLLRYMKELHELYHEHITQGTDVPMINGVFLTAVTLAKWPAALLITGEIDLAENKFKETMQLIESIDHPPTICQMFCNLVSDYFTLNGDYYRCRDLSNRALILAQRYDLGQCKEIAERALAWSILSLSRSESNGDELLHQRSPMESAEAPGQAGPSTQEHGPQQSVKRLPVRTDFMTGERYESILAIYVAALKSEWKNVKHMVDSSMQTVERSGTYLFSEYVRVRNMAMLSLAQENIGDDEIWINYIKGIRLDYQKCQTFCASKGLVFLALLAALDWFELELLELEHTRKVDEALHKVCKDTRSVLRMVNGGSNFPLVTQANYLLREYENILIEFADAAISPGDSDYKGNYEDAWITSTLVGQKRDSQTSLMSEESLLDLLNDNIFDASM